MPATLGEAIVEVQQHELKETPVDAYFKILDRIMRSEESILEVAAFNSSI